MYIYIYAVAVNGATKGCWGPCVVATLPDAVIVLFVVVVDLYFLISANVFSSVSLAMCFSIGCSFVISTGCSSSVVSVVSVCVSVTSVDMSATYV